MLTCEDKELLKQKGITEEQIAEQLACFEKGFPFLQLAGAASVDNNGIMVPDSEAQKKYLEAWDAYMQGPSKIVKFVPASGAASRMFKNMFEFLGADYDVPTTDFEKKFFDHIHSFAFFNDLNAACSDRRKCQGDVRQSAFPGRGGQTVAHRCRCSSRIVVQS